MIYRLLADAVLVVHLLFIVFVVLGALVVLRYRRVVWLHLPAAAWGVMIELFGWYCPLTPLENWLRLRGGAQGYSGGFIAHYLLPVIYPGELTREIQLGAGILVVTINISLYALVWRRRRRHR